MFQRLDRYLIREGAWLFLGLLALACSILLVERLVRLTEILSSAANPALDAVRLIGRLLPHYFELALPAAFLLTVILTVNRLSQRREITVMLSTGISLYRIGRPYVIVASALTALAILTSGYLDPLNRYNFRAVVFELQQNTLVAAFQENKFTQFNEWTVWTDGITDSDMSLGEVFILEDDGRGNERFMIGSSGALEQATSGEWTIILNEAMIGDVPADRSVGSGNQLSAGQIEWQVPLDRSEFRNRGSDERELTLTELITGAYEDTEFTIDPQSAAADLHDRVVRALILIVLAPFGVVLGLNTGRTSRSSGVLVGLIGLLVVQKMLEFGEAEAQQGAIPAWAGAWPVFGLLTIVTLYLFIRTNAAHARGGASRISWPFATAKAGSKDGTHA
ncbi:MAG: LptF/LptG family permease [Pseudomonadota bacterium]